MEYVYAAMLLHKADKEVNEDNMAAVLKAAGVEADTAKIKSLVASLEGIDIEKVIEETSVAPAAPAAGGASASEAPAASGGEEEKKEEKEEAPQADAAAGLGSLF